MNLLEGSLQHESPLAQIKYNTYIQLFYAHCCNRLGYTSVQAGLLTLVSLQLTREAHGGLLHVAGIIKYGHLCTCLATSVPKVVAQLS